MILVLGMHLFLALISLCQLFDAISVLVLCGFAPLRFSSVSVAVICIDSFICEILVFYLFYMILNGKHPHTPI